MPETNALIGNWNGVLPSPSLSTYGTYTVDARTLSISKLPILMSFSYAVLTRTGWFDKLNPRGKSVASSNGSGRRGYLTAAWTAALSIAVTNHAVENSHQPFDSRERSYLLPF